MFSMKKMLFVCINLRRTRSKLELISYELQVVAISVGVLSVAVGIGIPVFYETQIDNAVSVHSSSRFFFFFFLPLII